MEFNRLKASIANNAGQPPSIYMALCMVESLFEDIEDEFGEELSGCPVGDESLSTKLVWLCKTVNEIYEDNSDELQRNRARLDSAMAKLRKTESELTDLSSVAERLTGLRAEHAELEQKLLAAQDTKRQYEAVTAQCAQARQTLAALGQFDPDAAKADLAGLTGEIARLEKDQTELSGQLRAAKQKAEGLRQAAQELEAANVEGQRRIDGLTAQLDQKKTDAGRVQEALDALNRQHTELTAELEQLTQLQAAKIEETEALQKTAGAFRDETLAPVLAKLEALKQELGCAEQSKQDAQQEYEQCSRRRSELILDIARQKEANEAEQQNLKSAQDKLDKLQQDKQALEQALSAAIEKLDRLQDEVAQLTEKQLPELQGLVKLEEQRKESLCQQTAEAEAQRASLANEIREMEKELPRLEVDLKQNREVYDSLTANYAASTKELENLERQIAELRNKNDQEKLAIYRKQLEDNQRELERIQEECEQIRQENQRLVENLEAGQQERYRLLELKRKHESGNEATAKQLRELEFAGTREYAQEVAVIGQRLEMLEMVRGKLAASISKMRQALKIDPFDGALPLEDQLKTDLRELRIRTDDLRCALLGCANNLKMEEQ